jgi:serine/threonine-protein kinase
MRITPAAVPILVSCLLGACGGGPSDPGDASDDGHGDAPGGDGDGDAADDGDAPGGGDGNAPAGDADSAQTEGKSAYFPSGSWFLDDVYERAKAGTSDSMIAALRSAGGWGNSDTFQIDFGIDVLTADAAAPEQNFTPRTEDNGFEYDEFYSPDCDQVPVPLPPDGNVEGYDDYDCADGGDCHLIVYQPSAHKLYEAWRASISGGTFVSGCLAVWDTSKPAKSTGRGVQCTSADAAGFPIAPLLFTADEVKAGKIEHAIRFILPNDRPHIGFVPPATHGTETEGPEGAPYYGVHLRLRRDFPLDSLPSEGARVVARALQHYGMYHADGGDIALTAQSDRHTTAKWDGLLDAHDLSVLKVEDFEVIDHGGPIDLTYECMR